MVFFFFFFFFGFFYGELKKYNSQTYHWILLNKSSENYVAKSILSEQQRPKPGYTFAQSVQSLSHPDIEQKKT